MYGVKYKVPFKTISDRDSVVTLEERGYTGSVIELIAGGTPFNINIDQSDLLTPIRSSTATLAVVGSDYLQDLYANDPQGIRVKCEVDGEVKWLGYLLPDTFSQDFSSPEFVYEVELVAALSTLKYREFDLTDDFVTFRQIIEKAVEYSGYKVAYLTNSVRTSTGKFYDLKISSSNFYDELGEASTYYEALEEIAKYLGCCFVPFEDDLYLLDYAAIRKGFNSYTMLDGATATNVTLSDAKVVDNYKGTGAKISRIAGKNKAVVNCSLYEVKDILPAFNDEKSTFIKMESFSSDVKEGDKTITYTALIRYHKQPKYTFWKYDGGNPSAGYESEWDVNDGDTGAMFVRTVEYNSENVPVKLNFTNEISAKRYLYSQGADYTKWLSSLHPIFRIKSENRIMVHSGIFFCLGMQFKATQLEWKLDRDIPNNTFPSDGTVYIKVSFRIGEYYYNGASWSKNESTFKIPTTVKKGERILNTYRALDNTNTFDTGLGDLNGYVFNAPNSILTGDVELTIYMPDYPYDKVGVGTIGAQYVYIKDIQLSYGIPNEQSIYGDWVDKDSKNDVLYENVIDEEYIDEAEEIDLKICTNTDGKLALSSVIEGDEFLKTLVSDAYGEDLPEHLLLDRVIDMFDKPRFVIDPTLEASAKPYSLYTEPHLGKVFLVAGGEIDTKMESATYNLIEL